MLDRLDPKNQNNIIQDSIVKSISSYFPVESANRRLELVGSLKIDDNLDDYDFPKQLEVKLNRGTWQVPIVGNFRLIDKETGKVIDEAKNMKVANLPKMTDRISMMIDGNEYFTVNQFRLKPGIYTRVKNNGEIESQFNLEVGYNFKMNMDPQDGIFYLSMGNVNINLYALLHALGASDTDLKKAWGPELFEKNQRVGLNSGDKDIPKFWEKLKGEEVSYNTAAERIKEYFNSTKISPETTKITLGEAHDKVSVDTLVATSHKLLKVMRGEEPEDERDSIVFKELNTVDDLLTKYFIAKKKTLERGIKTRLDVKESIREIVPSETYSKPIKEFFTVGDLSSPIPQTNPIEMINEWRKTTIMGTGGIQSSHAVTLQTRDVHPSHFGFLDPLNTAEGANIGINIGLGAGVVKDEQGIKTTITRPNGETAYMTPFEVWTHKIGFPDEHKDGTALNKKVRVMYQGKPDIVDASEVHGYIAHPANLFNYATNTVPFLGYTSGNRALVAAKMSNQALPLVKPESPLVKVTDRFGNPMDQLIGSFLDLHVPLGFGPGKVVKVEDKYITIENNKGEQRKLGLYKDFPLNQDTFITHTPIVKVGDTFKAQKKLATTNFNDDTHHYASGLNVNVAYIPWKGNTLEDAVVITESLAKKFSSSAMKKYTLQLGKDSVLNLKKFQAYFPDKITPANAAKLDENGVIKIGEKISPNEVLVTCLNVTDLTDSEKVLKHMNKMLSNPYRDGSLTWDEHVEGTVTHVNHVGNNIYIYAKVEKPMELGDKLCYDKDTDVLTTRGWVNITNLTLDDQCASMNDAGILEYVSPSEINVYPHIGKMHRVETTQVDLLVTPEHRHLAKKRRSEKFELIAAKDIFGKRYNLKKNVINANTKNDDIYFEPLEVVAGQYGHGKRIIPGFYMSPENYMMLLGMFLSEGSCFKGSSGYGIDISQFKSEGVEIMLEGLKTSGLKYMRTKSGFRIFSKQMQLHFDQFGKSWEKFIPNWVFDYDPKYLEILFKWLMWGDGHITKTSMCYTTTSKQLADDIQRLTFLIGLSSNIKVTPAGEMFIIRKVYKTRERYDVYTYRNKFYPTINHGHIKTQNGQKEAWVDYEGNVYCPTLPKYNVLYVRRNGKSVWSGNSSFYGDKGIVSKIIPDNEAPHTMDGTRIDLMVNPHGVPSRMNMGQILMTAAGKIAQKTGKPYIVENFSNTDYLNQITEDLKKHKIPINEVLLDGKDGKPFENPIFWGNKHYMKLVHTVSKKQKVRGLPGIYDSNEQPIALDEKGQTMDPLQTYALLAHGSKENLFEMAAVKGQKNDEYWRALQLGLPTPPPQKNFVFEKMMAYMKGAGINVEKNGYNLTLSPLTDKQILAQSGGELTDAGHMLVGKNLESIQGGLFDEKIFGMDGTKWAHMELPYRIPNPVFEKPIQSLLNLTSTAFEAKLKDEGPDAIAKELKKVDVDAELREATKALNLARPSDVNKLNRKVRYLQALKKFDLTPYEAYTITKIPVLPPTFRPIFTLPSGDLQVSPINKHYRDVALVSKGIQDLRKLGVGEDMQLENKHNLYMSVKAMQGLTDPLVKTNEKYEGLLATLAGDSPKSGFVQSKIWGRKQDLSARSTITLDPSLGVDEVGVPDEISKQIFKPFIIRQMVRQGFKPVKAVEEYKNWSPIADNALNIVMKERPILFNRAPSLHKHNTQAMIPLRTTGNDIKINGLTLGAFGNDFDGDTMSIHVPVADKAVTEAWTMLPSMNLYKAGAKTQLAAISQGIVDGVYLATLPGKDTKKTFKTETDAKNAGLHVTDQFTLGGKKVTLGKLAVNKVLPKELQVWDKPFNKPLIEKTFGEVYNNHKPQFANVIDTFNEIGVNRAHDYGITVSLSDINFDRNFRDKIIAKHEKQLKPGMNAKQIAEIYENAKKEVVAEQDKLLTGKNNIYTTMESGSMKSKKSSIDQILAMPGIMMDLKGNPIPFPIKKSWSEGLNSFDYFNQSYGARSGAVSKSINTQESGALNKELLFSGRAVLVTEEDCNTPEFIEENLNDRHIMDRYLAKDIPGVGKRNELVTSEIVRKATSKKLAVLPVRSPLTCEADHGVCVKCYGITAEGTPPRIGENVGVLDSQAISEASTNLALKAFHTGGSAAGQSKALVAFPRLEQLLRVPDTLADKATLASEDGMVSQISINPAGGYDVYVNMKVHYIPVGQKLLVSQGSTVKKGDQLSDGVVKPQELGELRDHLTAQRYVVNGINDVYENKMHRRTFETVVHGTSNNARVLSVPKGFDRPWLRGDIVPYNLAKKINRERHSLGQEPIQVKPFFQSIDMLPMNSNDWLGRLATNRLMTTFTEGPAVGMTSNVKGPDPLTAYLYGTEFGKNFDPSKGQFY